MIAGILLLLGLAMMQLDARDNRAGAKTFFDVSWSRY
jgi:hypothetical protein